MLATLASPDQSNSSDGDPEDDEDRTSNDDENESNIHDDHLDQLSPQPRLMAAQKNQQSGGDFLDDSGKELSGEMLQENDGRRHRDS